MRATSPTEEGTPPREEIMGKISHPMETRANVCLMQLLTNKSQNWWWRA